jgi:hypothetical protein
MIRYVFWRGVAACVVWLCCALVSAWGAAPPNPSCSISGSDFVCTADLDGDGKEQVVIGNWGQISGTSGYVIIVESTGAIRKQICWDEGTSVCPNAADGPTLQVSPTTGIAFSGPEGGPFQPASFQFQLSATSGSLNYHISGTPPWLNASSFSGTVGTSPTPVTFTLVNAGNLAPGAYTGTVAFANTNNASGSTTRTATLVVNGPLTAAPASGPAPLAVTLATMVAQGDPNTYTVNFGDGTSNGAMSLRPSGIACTVTGPCFTAIASASHTYAAPGTYTATLLNSALFAVATASITVTGSSPPASPMPGVTGVAPNVSFTATSPSTPRAGIEYNRIDPSGGIASPHNATTEVPFVGGNATVPTISSFTASPASISPYDGGGSATLSWSVASATSLSISGLGAVLGNSIQVSPSQTTTYTLTASNAQGAVTAQTTVTVAGYRWRRVDPLSR